MFKIKLNNNNAYKWYNNKKIYVIGHLVYENKIYKGKNFIDLLKSKTTHEIIELIKNNPGFFSIVILNKTSAIIISDIVRTFPVFYVVNNNNILITDSVENFIEINEKSIEEMKVLRYVTSNNTLYKGVYQLENSQIVSVSLNGKIKTEKYYCFYNSGILKVNKNEKFKELDTIFITIFNELITYLNGRTAVIPLSGGHDSRLIAYYLKQLNYPKILTYTYGNKNGGEVSISKKVAEHLELKWVFIPYKRRKMISKYNSTIEFTKICNYCGRGYSIPHLQEWEAIDYLLNKKIINKSFVIIPGHTLDFISGNHIRAPLLKKDVTLNTVKNLIYKDNYNLYKTENSKFDDNLRKKLGVDVIEDRKITVLNACNLLENWDFEERQSKFIVNSIRIYDYYNLEWYIPFWNIKLVDFFKNLPLKDRYKRTFFNEFTLYKYGDLMKQVPIFKPKEKNKKNKGIIKLFKNVFTVLNSYFNHYLKLFSYFKFKNYLINVIKYKVLSYDFFVALDYSKLLKKQQKIAKKFNL